MCSAAAKGLARAVAAAAAAASAKDITDHLSGRTNKRRYTSWYDSQPCKDSLLANEGRL